MAHAVATRGYQATSVAEVIRLAGVSRTTFYEHFSNKQECFVAAHEMMLYRMMKNIHGAYQSAGDWDRSLNAAFDALANEIVTDPWASRMIVIGVADVGPAPPRLAQRARAVCERTLRQNLADSPRGANSSAVLTRGILSGIWHVTRRCLLEDRMGELASVCEELRGWARSYHLTALNSLTETEPLGPAGAHVVFDACLPPNSETRRLCASWPTGVRASLKALTNFLTAHPTLARLDLADISHSRGTSATRVRELLDDFGVQLHRGAELTGGQLSQTISQAITAAAWENIRHVTASNATQPRAEFFEELADLALTPLLGSVRGASSPLSAAPARLQPVPC